MGFTIICITVNALLSILVCISINYFYANLVVGLVSEVITNSTLYTLQE